MNHSTTMIYRNMDNKHTLYFNMCHHYRKILNAKACVDSCLPKIMNSKTNNQKRFSRGNSLISQKFSNLENFQQKTQETLRKSISRPNEPIICQYYHQHHCTNEEKKVDKSFAVSTKPFSPTILKTIAQSKLRESNVYRPPRKKHVMLKVSDKNRVPQVNLKDEKFVPVTHKLTEMKNSRRKNPELDNCYSEESSQDSAYNEGEGVLSGDSRGSTPQNPTSKPTTIVLRPESMGLHYVARSSTKTTTTENIVCLQFMKDITNDILKKNVFTNKALRNVFQHHVSINKYNLKMDKMLIEISKLQDRLGVPKAEKFDDEEFGLGNVTASEITNNPLYTEHTNEDKSLPSIPFPAELPPLNNSEGPSTNEDVTDQKFEGENDYSDNFSEEESSVSESQQEHNYGDDIIETDENEDKVDGVISEIEEEIQDTENEKEENCLDVEDGIQRVIRNVASETNSEISEISG